ncbi:MAG: helix-turn-helix domain-containing protein [Ferrimicrobium acidiphilum]
MGRPRRETSKNLQQAKLLADRIKALRNRLHLTQEELAHDAGLSVYTISKLERGERVDPSVFTMNALAQALNTTIDELLHGSGNLPKSARQETSTRSRQSSVTEAGRSQTKNNLPIPTSATKARRQRSPKRPEG